MKKAIVYIGFLFLVLFSAESASACDWCLISQGISPLETYRGAGVRVNERYTRLNKVYNGTDKVDNPGAREEYLTAEFTGFYAVNEDLMVLTTVPIRKTRMQGELVVRSDGAVEADPMKGKQEGLGDIAVLGRYTFYKDHTLDTTTAVAAVFGVKLPTGKTDGRTEDGNEFLDSHLQLGTGSTDFLAGISLSHVISRFTLSANILGSITTEGSSGDKTHRFGNMLNYDLTSKYRVYPGVPMPAGASVFVSIGVNGELRDREKEDGVKLKDSGGHTVYLSPGLQVSVERHWVFELLYQEALYHNLYGTQLGEDFKAAVSATYLF